MERKIPKKSFKAPIIGSQCVQVKSPAILEVKGPEEKKKKLKSADDKLLKAEKHKKPCVGLSDVDYEDIFSSVISRVIEEHSAITDSSITRFSCSDHNLKDTIEDHAAIPDPNEAFKPIEATKTDMGMGSKQVPTLQSKSFAKATPKVKKNAAENHINKTKPKPNEAKNTVKSSTFSIPAKKRLSKIPDETHTVSPPKKACFKSADTTASEQETNYQHSDEIKKKSKLSTNTQSSKQLSKTDESKLMNRRKLPMTAKCDSSSSVTKKDSKFDSTPTSGSVHSPAKVSGSVPTLKNHSQSMKPPASGSMHSQDSNTTQRKHPKPSLTASQGSVVRQLSQSQRSDIPLSQPPPRLNPRQRLEWLLERRDVGVWVQCGRIPCSKWRYLADTKDPIDVPHNWYCHMNPDPQMNSCIAPERGPTPLEEEDLIHNLYTAGSVVWGRLSGYPWWPAMVDDCPDVEQYYWINGFSDIPTHYNVVFFDEKDVTRAWLTPGALRAYTGQENRKEYRTVLYHGVNYEKRLQVAKQQATDARNMSNSQRLKKFGFLARYKGPIGKKKLVPSEVVHRMDPDEGDVNSEDEIRHEMYREERTNSGKQLKKNNRNQKKRDDEDNSSVKKARKGPAMKPDKNITTCTTKTKSKKFNAGETKCKVTKKNKAKQAPLMKNMFNNSIYTQEFSEKDSMASQQRTVVPVFSKPNKKNTPSKELCNDDIDSDTNFSDAELDNNSKSNKKSTPSKELCNDGVDSDTNFSDAELDNNPDQYTAINKSQDMFDEKVDAKKKNKKGNQEHNTNNNVSTSDTDSKTSHKNHIPTDGNKNTLNIDINVNKSQEVLRENSTPNIGNVGSQTKQAKKKLSQSTKNLSGTKSSANKENDECSKQCKNNNAVSSKENPIDTQCDPTVDSTTTCERSETDTNESTSQNDTTRATVGSHAQHNRYKPNQDDAEVTGTNATIDEDIIEGTELEKTSHLKSFGKTSASTSKQSKAEDHSCVSNENMALDSGVGSSTHISAPSTSRQQLNSCLRQPTHSTACGSQNSDAVVPQIELQLAEIINSDDNNSSDFEPEE